MATEKKAVGRRLGRGLGSLIGSPVSIDKPVTSSDQPTEADDAPKAAGVVPDTILVSKIVPNQAQPRQRFDEEAIASLARSIENAGLMQPIVVREASDGYELVAGERRWRAFQSLGRTEIPAIVRAVDDRTAAEWAMIENLQREDLDPIERADGIAALIERYAVSQTEVASQLGIDRATVSNLLRLREADVDTRDAIQEGLITQGHAKALLGCQDLVRRKGLLGKCVREGWSVRETERQVQSLAVASAGASTRSDRIEPTAHVVDLEKRLSLHLGTKVGLKLGRKKGQGRVTLDFYSLEQFDGLLEKMGFDPNAQEQM